MRKNLLFTGLLLAIGGLTTVQAQTKAARAPARKTIQRATAPKPVVQKAPVVITPATNRSNSSALPKTTTPAPVAQPAPTPQRVSSPPPRRYASTGTTRRSYSGGSGFEKGDNLLNVGVGLSSYYYGHPIGLSYETGITEDISIGGQFDYNSGRYDDYYGYNYRYRYSAYYLGVRGSFHLNRLLGLNEKKVDLYAGLGVGYRSFKWNDTYYGTGYGYNYGSGLFANYFVGGKYYFTNKIGAFAELGYTGLSSSRLGISVKL